MVGKEASGEDIGVPRVGGDSSDTVRASLDPRTATSDRVAEVLEEAADVDEETFRAAFERYGDLDALDRVFDTDGDTGAFLQFVVERAVVTVHSDGKILVQSFD